MMLARQRAQLLALALAVIGGIPHSGFGQDSVAPVATPQPSLHERIDALIEQSEFGPPAPRANDAEFVRRAYLDLTGAIPTAAESRRFLDDAAADKRARLIDELLARPEFARQMAGFFDLMFMERRPDKYVTTEQWQTFLLAAMQRNTPYNKLAAEILAADGLDPRQRGAAKFYLDREVEPNLLTREVGRVFFGVDLECAQCHDHPIVNDYYQSDYYGLFAFVSRTFVYQIDGSRPAVLAEKAEGDANFKSVFTGVEGSTLPRLIGSPQIGEPAIDPAAAYQPGYDPANKTLRPIPAYSRRLELAKRATDGTNAAFNRNIVNRLWAHLLGRGLVHPVDLQHVDNPPAHPELLDLMAAEFAAGGFDVKNFVREVALTRAYARSSEMPADVTPHFANASQRLAEIEQLVAARTAEFESASAKLTEVRDALAHAREEYSALPVQLKTAGEALAAAKPPADSAAAALAEANTKLAALQEPASSLAEATTKVNEAAATLAQDQELAGIAAQLAAKSQQSAAGLEAAQADVVAKEAVAKTTGEALSTAEKTLTELNARQTALPAQIAAAEASGHEVRTVWQTATTALRAAEARHKQTQLLQSLAEKQAAAEPARAALVQAEAEHASALLAVQASQDTAAKATAAVAGTEQAHAAAATATADAATQLASQQTSAGLVAEALAKAEAADKALPGDPTLAAAIAALKTRSDELSAQVAESTKALEALTAQEKVAAEQLASAKQRGESERLAAQQSQDQLAAVAAKLQATREQTSAALATADAAQEEVTTLWDREFRVAPIAALTPEQLAWSIMQAAGIVERQRAASLAEQEAKSPLPPEDPAYAWKLAERQRLIEDDVFNKLRGNVAQFVTLFGGAAGQPQDEFFATVDQALFFGNGGVVQSWLAGDLTTRLMQLEDPKALAEEMYLSILSRRPIEEETARAAIYLAARPNDKQQAIQEMAWALLSSVEFRFQY